MKISDILNQEGPSFSFEFFPPKSDEGIGRLFERAGHFRELKPSFVSVTYGAGGTTRAKTRDLVVRLQREHGLEVAAHLTCVGHTRDELIEILSNYHAQGIENIVALRGDPPTGEKEFVAPENGLSYGNELVELIREHFPDMGIAVAGYPEGHTETASKLDDMDNLKRKVDAGADVVITQLFFDNRDFYDFCERCEIARVNVPIVAGIMPVISWRGIKKMCGLCGARLPARLLKRLLAAGDDGDRIAHIGIDWATQQCRDLLEKEVRGIHFYTLNKSDATLEIYRRLGASDSSELRELASI
jgi:methylenetetrahydrofolate reductase (NADPH)